jgi:hypothetical protein
MSQNQGCTLPAGKSRVACGAQRSDSATAKSWEEESDSDFDPDDFDFGLVADPGNSSGKLIVCMRCLAVTTGQIPCKCENHRALRLQGKSSGSKSDGSAAAETEKKA